MHRTRAPPPAGSASGCHSTPTQKRAPGSSIASSRRRRRPVAISPRRGCDALVVVGVHRRPIAHDRGAAGALHGDHVVHAEGAIVSAVRSSGRCCRPGAGSSVPPRATLSTCKPRQIAERGRSRASASVISRQLDRVAALVRAARWPGGAWRRTAPERRRRRRRTAIPSSRSSTSSGSSARYGSAGITSGRPPARRVPST